MNLRSLTKFFSLPAIGQVPANQLAIPPFFSFTGSTPDLGSFASALQGYFNFINANSGAPNFQTSAAATITLTNLQHLQQKLTNGGAVTVTLDSAYNIVNAIQNPFLGQSIDFTIMDTASTTVATPTLSDTAVTLVGTTTVTTGGFRWYQGTITQMVTTTGAQLTAGSTFVSIAQVGTTNNFTVTLATNTIVPVVGTAIFLNVTAGTLPAGWYPINKVSSATSFVIATPPGTVWTATAATVPGTTVIPPSQYTTGYTLGVSGITAGLYSPLVTITGVMGMAAGVMVT